MAVLLGEEKDARGRSLPFRKHEWRKGLPPGSLSH